MLLERGAQQTHQLALRARGGGAREYHCLALDKWPEGSACGECAPFDD